MASLASSARCCDVEDEGDTQCSPHDDSDQTSLLVAKAGCGSGVESAIPVRTYSSVCEMDSESNGMSQPNPAGHSTTHDMVAPGESSKDLEAKSTSDSCKKSVHGVCCSASAGGRQLCDDVTKGYRVVRRKTMAFSCRNCMQDTCSVQNVKGKFPITKWLPKYNLSCLQGDVIAGLTVGLTVIPQSLALAGLAELPPQYGLYSAFMSCFVYTFLGTAKDITLGPTAIMSLLTAEFAASPVHGDPTIAVVLTLFCGIIQFLMGVLRLGFLVDFISYPVITGFTTAAALTIAFSQVKTWFGLSGDAPRDFIHRFIWTCKHIKSTKVPDLVLGIVVIIFLYLMKKLKMIKWREGPDSMGRRVLKKTLWLLGTARNAIIVLVTAGLAAILYHENLDYFTLTNTTQSGLPPFKVPDFHIVDGNTTYGPDYIFKQIGSGFAIIPLLGIVETIAIGKAFARRGNYRIDSTQEFIAMGVANVASCFVQAYPVTGSFSRTAVNYQSGVKTPAAGIVTGGLVMLALAVLTPFFFYIPTAALAGVIIMAVIDMVDFGNVLNFFRVKPLDVIPWLTTFIFSFILGIEYGIMLGVGVSLLLLLYPWARPTFKVTKEETLPIFQNIQEDIVSREVAIVQLDLGMQFPGVEHISMRVLEEVYSDNVTRNIILDCTHVSTIDYSAVQGIRMLFADIEKSGAELVLSNVQPQVLKVLHKAKIDGLRYSTSNEEAIRSINEEACDIEENPQQSLVTAEQHDPGAATPDTIPVLHEGHDTPPAQGSPHNRLNHSPQAVEGHFQLEVPVEDTMEPPHDV